MPKELQALFYHKPPEYSAEETTGHHVNTENVQNGPSNEKVTDNDGTFQDGCVGTSAETYMEEFSRANKLDELEPSKSSPTGQTFDSAFELMDRVRELFTTSLCFSLPCYFLVKLPSCSFNGQFDMAEEGHLKNILAEVFSQLSAAADASFKLELLLLRPKSSFQLFSRSKKSLDMLLAKCLVLESFCFLE